MIHFRLRFQIKLLVLTFLIITMRSGSDYIMAQTAPGQIEANAILLADAAPLPFIRIIIIETETAYETDASGRFRFSIPETGHYTFRIISNSGIIHQRHNITHDGQSLTLRIASGSEGTTEITGERGLIVRGIRDRTNLSRYSLEQEEMRRLPGAYGDSLKAVQTLPGISPALPVGVLPSVDLISFVGLEGFSGIPYSNSSSGFLVIRGSGARGNQFLFDGFKIQYPFHLGDQASVLNNDMIHGVDVYTGTYPVRYGNATGGIVSIRGPEEVSRPGGHVNVATFLSDAHFETPFLNNGFIVAAVRKSYPNYALLAAYPEGIPPNAKYANYEDGQLKIHLESDSGNHSLDLVYFGARDRLDYTRSVAEADRNSEDSPLFIGGIDAGGFAGGGGAGFDANTDSRPPVGLDRRFNTTGGRYNYKTSFSQSSVQIQTSRFKEDFELAFDSPATGEKLFEFEVLNARREFELRSDHILEILPEHIYLETGAEAWWYRWELSLDNLSPRQSFNPDTPDFVETINQLIDSNRTFRALYDGDRTEFKTTAAFAELELLFWRLRLTPGIRSDFYSLSNSTGISPRMGVELSIEETGTLLMASASRHFNLPPGLEQVSQEAGNPFLKMEEADHVTAGIEQDLGKDWLVKVEFFRNTFRNLVVSDSSIVRPYSVRQNKRDLAEIPNELIAEPLEARPLFFSNKGTGFSEGAELFLRKKRRPGAAGWFGWLSYTYSETRRNNHQPRLNDEERAEKNRNNLNREALAYFPIDKHALIYYDTGEYEFIYDNDKEELYDLDRTHQVSLVLNYRWNPSWQIGLRFRYLSGTPFTPITSAEGFGDVFRTYIPEYSEFYQSERLPDFHQLDIRIDRFHNYEWGYFNYYIEFINIYARRNVERYDFNFLYPYVPGFNPEPSYESTYIEIPGSGGKKTRIPLINIGMEIRF